MSPANKKLAALFVPVFVVIALDQWTKHLIRTIPELQYTDIIEGVLAFHYTQNPGMAMGIDLADTFVISLVAIFATVLISFYIYSVFRLANNGFLICMGLILGGAGGNIIDRFIMGYIDSHGGLLEGHVVDFIHFNLEIYDFAVFPYIFNVADIAISVAIVSLLIFYRKLMPEQDSKNKSSAASHSDNRQHSSAPNS